MNKVKIINYKNNPLSSRNCRVNSQQCCFSAFIDWRYSAGERKCQGAGVGINQKKKKKSPHVPVTCVWQKSWHAYVAKHSCWVCENTTQAYWSHCFVGNTLTIDYHKLEQPHDLTCVIQGKRNQSSTNTPCALHLSHSLHLSYTTTMKTWPRHGTCGLDHTRTVPSAGFRQTTALHTGKLAT